MTQWVLRTCMTMRPNELNDWVQPLHSYLRSRVCHKRLCSLRATADKNPFVQEVHTRAMVDDF
jgi:hypothetical protein